MRSLSAHTGVHTRRMWTACSALRLVRGTRVHRPQVSCAPGAAVVSRGGGIWRRCVRLGLAPLPCPRGRQRRQWADRPRRAGLLGREGRAVPTGCTLGSGQAWHRLPGSGGSGRQPFADWKEPPGREEMAAGQARGRIRAGGLEERPAALGGQVCRAPRAPERLAGGAAGLRRQPGARTSLDRRPRKSDLSPRPRALQLKWGDVLASGMGVRLVLLLLWPLRKRPEGGLGSQVSYLPIPASFPTCKGRDQSCPRGSRGTECDDVACHSARGQGSP